MFPLKRTMLVLFCCLLIVSGVSCMDNANTDKSTSTEKPKSTTGVVKIGDTAPDFEMRNQEQLKVALSDFKGKKNVVVVFYPADFTPI